MIYSLYIYPRTNSGDKWAEARTTIKADAYKFEWRENSAQWEEVSEEEFFELCSMGEEFADAVYDGKSMWFTEEPHKKFTPQKIKLKRGRNILIVGGEFDRRKANLVEYAIDKSTPKKINYANTKRKRQTEYGCAQPCSTVFSKETTIINSIKSELSEYKKIEIPKIPELGWVTEPPKGWQVFVRGKKYNNRLVDYVLVEGGTEKQIYEYFFRNNEFSIIRMRPLRKESVMAYKSAGRVFYEI